MVLAGTCLTALVGYYVLPFGWSFNLAMVSVIGGFYSVTKLLFCSVPLILIYLCDIAVTSIGVVKTFGSILSATDPVAVAALLEEVGAPPRLKIHIGGESTLLVCHDNL